MKRFVKWIFIGILILAPAGAMAQETLDALILELNLSRNQIDQVRWFYHQFDRKQGSLPNAVDVALQHREAMREVITGAPFNLRTEKSAGGVSADFRNCSPAHGESAGAAQPDFSCAHPAAATAVHEMGSAEPGGAGVRSCRPGSSKNNGLGFELRL